MWHGMVGGVLAAGTVVVSFVVPLMPTESKVDVSDVAEGRVVVCMTGLTGLLSSAVKLSTSVCVLSNRAVRRRWLFSTSFSLSWVGSTDARSADARWLVSSLRWSWIRSDIRWCNPRLIGPSSLEVMMVSVMVLRCVSTAVVI